MNSRERKKQFEHMQAELERKKREYLSHPGHRLVTRRDFLASGIKGYAATATLPLLGLLHSSSALAAESPGMSPVRIVRITAAGGFASLRNLIAKDQAGALISSYTNLGLGTQADLTGRIRNTFGLDWYARDPLDVTTTTSGSNGLVSPLVRNAMSPEGLALIQSSVRGLAIAHPNGDDTNMDLDPFNLFAKLTTGRYTSLISNNSLPNQRMRPVLGRFESLTGANGQDDIQRAIGLGGVMFNWSRPEQIAAFQLQRVFGNLFTRDRAELANSAQVTQAVAAAGDQNFTSVNNPPPTVNLASGQARENRIADIWRLARNNGVVTQAAINSMEGRFAALVLAHGWPDGALVGPVNLEIGGYDNHSGVANRVQQDTQDHQLLLVLQSVIASLTELHLMNVAGGGAGQPFVVYLTSDGGQRSGGATNADGNVSDNGGARATLAFFGGMNRPFNLVDYSGGLLPVTNMVGYYTNGQEVARGGVSPVPDEIRGVGALAINVAAFMSRMGWLVNGVSPLQVMLNAIGPSSATPIFTTQNDINRVLRIDAV